MFDACTLYFTSRAPCLTLHSSHLLHPSQDAPTSKAMTRYNGACLSSLGAMELGIATVQVCYMHAAHSSCVACRFLTSAHTIVHLLYKCTRLGTEVSRTHVSNWSMCPFDTPLDCSDIRTCHEQGGVCGCAEEMVGQAERQS